MEDTGIMTRKPFEQHVANLPQEILKEPRFVFLGKNVYTDAAWIEKAPEPNWQSPRKQRLYSDINGFVSFVATTPEFGGFIFYDLNNVLDGSGRFVNETAEEWYKTLHVPGTYCEKSISGRGLHMFAKTTTYDDALKGTFEIPLNPDDPACKLRVFFGTNMTCIVTGDCFNCAPNAPVPVNEVADAVYMKVLTAANVKLPTGMALAEAKPDMKPAHAKTSTTAGKVFRDNLTKSELERIKNDLRIIPPDEVANKLKIDDGRKNGFVCPDCGNGTGKDGTGIKPSFWSGHWEWHCQSCHKSWDNVELIAAYLGKSTKGQEFWEVVKEGAKMFHVGYTVKGEYVTPDCLKTPPPPEKEYTPKDYTNFYNNVARPGLDKFLRKFPNGQWRGLTRKTLEYFFCGYTPEFGVAKAPAVIVPYSVNHFFARFVGDKSKLSKKQQDALREKYHTTGPKPIFNAKRGLDTDKPIFVVESATDAMSIRQAGGYNVIAVSGSTLSSFMCEQLKPYTGKKFIVMLDGDAAGQAQKQKLVDELHKLGHAATSAVLSDVHKDANDFLQADADGLAARLKDIYDDALKFFDNPPPEPEKPKTLNLTTHDYDNINAKLADDPPESKSASDPAIDEWQDINGTIAPAVLPMLLAAKKYLDALTVDKITSAIAQSSKTKEAVALCKFYDCYIDVADKFLANLSTAKRNAKAKIKQLSILGGQFAENPPADLVALANISLTDLANGIRTLFNTHKRAHKSFQEFEAKRKAQEERAAKQEAQLMKMENARERLGKLKALPKTPERDKAIIETIKELCSWRLDSHDNPIKIEATQQNLDRIFENDPNLAGLVAYDEFTDADIFLKAPPWHKEKRKSEQWQDTDDEQLRCYLRRTYQEISNDKFVYDTVTDYANKLRFHVVKDYIKSLPAWDGKPRAETFFIDWLQVPDSRYSRVVTMNWLLGAMARIFYPGCEYQTVLVLQGNQGIGKDFNLKKLAAGWHAAITDSLDSDDAIGALRLAWLAVFEEMHAVSKSSVNAVKSFISRNEDTRREKYGRRHKRIPRHCVFAISTNDEQFLSDLTGNRRYMILHCGSKRSKPVKIVRGEKLTDQNTVNQIWAEVYTRFQKLFDGVTNINDVPEKLQLPDDVVNQAAEFATRHLSDNGGSDAIVQEFINTKIPAPVIWDLLSREQRRQFFVDRSITLDVAELNFKRRARGGRDVQKDIDDIGRACNTNNGVRRIDMQGRTLYQFFGSHYRQHICAAEILDECFDKTDKRRQPARIRELLAHIDGWELGKRLKRDPAYGDQRVVYWRDGEGNLTGDDTSPAPATVDTEKPTAEIPADNTPNNVNSVTHDCRKPDAAKSSDNPESKSASAIFDGWAEGEPVDSADVPFELEPQPDPNETASLPDDDDTPF